MPDKDPIIIITGAAGFIGSCLVSYLNREGFENLVLVDEFDDEEKEKNLTGKKYIEKIERESFFNWIDIERPEVKFVFHLGARTDTAEFNYAIHQHLNVEYSQKIWHYCSTKKIQLVYASSAATYGLGEFGYDDDESKIEVLSPLNPYGISKNEFDKWALRRASRLERDRHDVLQQAQECPPFWAGLKFFNVYGPNEYHKGRMASMIFHSYNQIQKTGSVKLFKSYAAEFKDGEQLRDFIYVKDVIKICYWFMNCFLSDKKIIESGIYNVGTGIARAFKDLVTATFTSLEKKADIVYIDMPEDIKETYQYYTKANMEKIKLAGYVAPLYSLEEGVDDYVRDYLSQKKYY